MEKSKSVARRHALTHPILGPVTWAELQEHVIKLREQENRKACWWCFGEVPAGRKTRCAADECSNRIMEIFSWAICRARVMKDAKGKCVTCGEWAAEVDHIIPVVRGGTSDRSNLRALCSVCHRKETNLLAKERAIERKKAAPQIFLDLTE